MTVIPKRCTSYLPIMFSFQILLCFVVTNSIYAENTNDPIVSRTGSGDSPKPNKTELSRPGDQSDTDVTSSGLPGDQDILWLDGEPRGALGQFSPVGMTWSPDLNDSPAGPEWRDELEEDVAPSSYDKRFMRGFQKRFMRGFQKRFPYRSPVYSLDGQISYPRYTGEVNDYRYRPNVWMLGKRFMRGLTKRSVPSMNSQAQNSGAEPLDKRFMRGFTKKDAHEEPSPSVPNDVKAVISEDSADKDKRFMRGLADFGKRESELTDEEMTSDKRFMRGFTKKEDKTVDDKRFMRGLIKKENTEEDILEDKRFMRGFTKKDDSSITEDKRFMRGFTKKDDSAVTEDKRFMRGFTKKDDPVVTEDKRFMRGFTKKDDSAVTEDKRFMRGFTKKDDLAVTEDKRFMRGFTKKDEIDGEVEKRFMRGLIKKDFDLANEKRFMRGFQKRFMRGFTKKDLDKRFMRGLIKKASEDKDKRFMRGLVRREADSGHRVKRQTRFNDHSRNPILEKLEDEYSGEEDDDQEESDLFDYPVLPSNYPVLPSNYPALPSNYPVLPSNYPELPSKRFMRGFDAYFKRNLKNHRFRGSEIRHDLGKRFMRGFQAFDDAADKRFTLNRPAGSDWYNDYYDNLEASGIPEKRFIKGLDAYFLDQPVSKRFMRGFDTLSLQAPEKRFLRGLEYYEPRSRNSYGIHAKLPTGLDKRYLLEGYDPDYETNDSKSLWLSNWYNRHGQSDN